ncbi:tryptophan halogenase family protein [Asticcacaulis sp. AC402]|uniref:tryptophan halogenase family protein n=1 Tax=Asticcacaulis sp. AC402 TaxID=1282361 RepID=UPI0003C3B311|nr:tryptophan halogenase family protein [Asticcacaulis sp. AC402]ESQ75676.1 tryptophan halogenase [Asticcacaulis sp. AC402]
MEGHVIKRVVIAGGGTAGWCAAAALSRLLGPLLDITLVESDDIGIVGVGEATIPTVRTFHHLLGIDERDFLRATNGTFKLGIAFENWARPGDRYIHAFGTVGKSSWMAPFHHIWLQARSDGYGGELSDYCLELQAAEAGKFQTSEKSGLNYAYHFDAGLYGQFLRGLSEKHGVKRVEGKISQVEQEPESGFIAALHLESGEVIEGDLFIDCTGFRGLLIEQTLKTGYEDWTHWLPMNRAVAVQTQSLGPLNPYTRAIAHDAGWRWRIPLQNRVGNGLVYSSAYLSDDAAHEQLMGALDAPTLVEPRQIKFVTGRRRKTWNKNCVTLGLSSGFIEPLESTSIHLFQIGVTRLIQMFPFNGISPSLIDHFNTLSAQELEMVRDFVILHYKANQRGESGFWRDRQTMSVPDSLMHRIEVFAAEGIAWQAGGELFRLDSWLQVMMGQRIEPRGWHRLGQLMKRPQAEGVFRDMKASIDRAVAGMMSHEQFVRQYCAMQETA